MSRVKFIYKNGRERMMSERDARILTKLKRGSYMTRDMRAEAVPVVVTASLSVNEYEACTLEELHQMARERGFNLHHRTGRDKVVAALREAD